MKTNNNSYFSRIRNYHGFTLVELIVVITILVILGAIAFTSLVGYSMSARDSSRVSDLDNIAKALDLTKVKTGYYPTPSSSTEVTFSGGIVWYQGTVGDSVVDRVNSAGFKLSKKPTDPKYPTVEYTYSVLESNKEYQVSAAMEDSSTAMYPIITPAYAAMAIDTPAYAAIDTLSAYIKGNYNGVMATSKTTGGDVCILALPSIILQDIVSASGTILDSGDPVQKNNLVLHKKTNLPGSYTSNSITTASDGHFVYTPLQNGNSSNAGSGLTVYCSGSLPANTGSLAIVTENLKTIYGSSGLSTDSVSAPWIADFLVSPTQNTAVANVLHMSLGGASIAGVTDTPVAGGSIPPPEDIVPTDPIHFGFNPDTQTITWYDYSDIPDIVIPSTINGVVVKNIGDEVFWSAGLKSVRIPNSIISIGNSVFPDNSALTSAINYDGISSNEYIYISDGSGGVKIVQYFGTSKTPVIPSTINGKTVTAIGGGAFRTMGLTALTIPNTIKSIGKWAFVDGLFTTVTIPDSVITIEGDAFNTGKLTSVIIGNGVTSIGSYAFHNNELISITIGNNVTSISWSAFANQWRGVGGGTVYGPASGYVKDTYTANTGGAFDKVKLPNYIGL